MRILEAVGIILFGFLFYFTTKKFVFNMIKNSKKKFDERKYKTLKTICSSVIKYIIFFIIICMIFNLFNIDIKSILALAGVGSVTIGLAAQNIIKDFITGVLILFEGQFAVGDEVIIADKTGIVESITTRTTTLRGKDGELYIIPNGEIKIVTNKSK